MIQMNKDICNHCTICWDACPNYVIELNRNGNGNAVSIRYPDHCNDCGHCISLCPTGAISHDDLPHNEFEKIPKIDITTTELKYLIFSRRSTRCFKSDPVPGKLIEQLLEVAVHAGSAGNLQDEAFQIINDQQLIRKLEKTVVDILWNNGLKFFTSNGLIAKLLSKKYGPRLTHQYTTYHKIIKHRKENNELPGMIFRDAPLLIIVHGLKMNPSGGTNGAIAVRNMELLALTMGLATCWAGFLITAAHMARKKINRLLEIDKSRKIYGALMVGYPKYNYDFKIPRKKRRTMFR